MEAVKAAQEEIQPRCEGKLSMLFVGGSRAHHYQDLFNEIGIVSSRAAHAAVYINEKYYGLYISVEHIDENFFVTNGDELKNINLQEMFEFHVHNRALISVALTLVDNPSEYGVAIIEDNKIREFIEKPEKPPSNLINSGLSIWHPDVIDMIPEGFSMYEKAIFPKLAGQEKLYGYIFHGQWFDTGTKERYEIAIKEWLFEIN